MDFSMTRNAKQALDNSVALAKSLNTYQVGTEHLLYGLASVQGSCASKLLAEQGITEEVLRDYIIKMGNQTYSSRKTMEYTPRVKSIISAAADVALQVGTPYIVTEHLLYVLLVDSGSQAVAIIKNLCGNNYITLRHRAYYEITGIKYDPNIEKGNSYEQEKTRRIRLASKT